MAYEPTNWSDGDIVTAEKLNKIEQGVTNAGAGSGGGMVVEINAVEDDMVMNHTWKEIYDAAPLMPIAICIELGTSYMLGHIVSVESSNGEYFVTVVIWNNGYVAKDFIADSEDGYPYTENSQ